jgi:putative PIG3 family NAD(P)H quinone oxidoreductase
VLAVRPFHGAPGTEAAIELVEVSTPTPGAGEVLIRVAATALNRADLLQMRGLYPPPPGESEVPGLECAGAVAAVGAGVEELAIGDRVMALLAGGGHAEQVIAPAGQVLRVPSEMSAIQAAAVPEVGVTAWTNLVYEGGLARGQTLLITGAASGVGSFATQVAKAIGARVIVAGRSLERLRRLVDLGADSCVQLGPSLPEEVREQTDGAGADLVLELVGGVGVRHSLAALRDRGCLVLVGVLDGARAELDLGVILRRRLRIVGSVLRSRSREEKTGLVVSFGDFGLSRLKAGTLRPVIDRVVPFREIARAYRELGAGGVLGKVVLSLDSPTGERAPAAGTV